MVQYLHFRILEFPLIYRLLYNLLRAGMCCIASFDCQGIDRNIGAGMSFWKGIRNKLLHI